MLILGSVVRVIVKYEGNNNTSISKYGLLKPTEYKLEQEKRRVDPFMTMSDGRDIKVQNLVENPYIALGTADDESIILVREWVSDKLAGVMYITSDKVMYAFGKDKPVNIMFGAPATESGDPYDSPLYIGYYDGTCEYPAEFDYIRSKKKCIQYLQDTLDFVGYSTVDEMLEDVLGQYITKDEN